MSKNLDLNSLLGEQEEDSKAQSTDINNTIYQTTGLKITGKTDDMSGYVKIDADAEASEKAAQKIEKAQIESTDALSGMFDDVLGEELARLQRAVEVTSDPEKVKELISDEQKVNNDTVHYAGVTETVSRDNANKNLVSDIIDTDDLMPSYDYDEMDNVPKATDSDSVSETEQVEDDEAVKITKEYVSGLEVSKVETDTIVKNIRDRVTDIPSRRNSGAKIVGDQAFINAVTKYKRDNFGVVRIPLVNSGFCIDMVGTGIVDLRQLYAVADENINPLEYEIAQMRIMIRNIVNTTPKIDPNNLRNMIHYQDYQLMAFAHICATLKTVQMVTNCDDCGSPFRIEAKSSSLILNMKELQEKKERIESSPSVDDVSLMTSCKKIVTDSGFEVVIGHPSYADQIQIYGQITAFSSTMDNIEKEKFFSSISQYSYIRSIMTPMGIKTNNVYQIYQTIKLMNSTDEHLINKEISEFMKQAIIPKFGIKSVTCPHCGKVNTDIVYESLQSILFLHTQVSRLIEATED